MRFKKQTAALVVMLAAGLTVVGWFLNWGVGVGVGADYVHEIRKNIEIFGLVYQEISKKYVEPVDPDKFMKAGINGMLETLDPYTTLIEDESNSHLQIITTGKYGGLGMRIGAQQGWPTVVEQPFEDDPAGKAGIREGDRIIMIDGQSTKGLSINEVAKRLRGEIGTPVTLKIEREGEPEPLEFRLIRAEITILDVSYSGIIRDGVGYIKLSGFSKNAGYEIRQAIRELQPKGMKSLILDLRNNPGGLLEAAVSVTENFIRKGELVVSTRGRIEESVKEYRSDVDPIAGDLPLVVLVNEFSASASEIVAGAIQDHDRGVVIGQPTFGKGLVQTVVPITRDAALKITTAKYYIPSGRLIQRVDRLRGPHTPEAAREEGEGEGEEGTSGTATIAAELNHDSTHVYYTLKNRREMRGGGGIQPDLRVEVPPLNRYQYELRRKSLFFHFALTYASQHRDLPRNFTVDDNLLAQFRAFLAEKGFTYVSESEDRLADLKKAAAEEGYGGTLSPEINRLESALQTLKADDFNRNRDYIARELEREIAAKLFGTRAKVEATFDDDPYLAEAIKVLQNQERYLAILGASVRQKG
ncbi:MAG: S41 family peptidase [candidate division KSB1 bacterium]|nr:S41 family peptidase [candidate division KSB1 bacterium]MDZ7273282.1 S41 family peptidase [candidate division KSB1 bacterium]MDZ7285384.1 S41 family peptidase [candidate division KSB1 bacterium]MDZ7298416.1 S41 family peptidase [candidate division KSB1 bacterium]MDZ7307681.1 S41 family peptidase [candidate division KSB1 bacterium]